MGRLLKIFGGRGGDFRNWATAHFCPFMVSLGTVMAPVGVSFSMPMHYSEHTVKLKVNWKSNLPPSWTYGF